MLLAMQSSRLKKSRLCLDVMEWIGLCRIDKVPEKKGGYYVVKDKCGGKEWLRVELV